MKPIYTKELLKSEINNLIAEKGYDPVEVAKFASKIFFKYQSEIDLNMRQNLLDIMTMEDGPEFELTKEEFYEFMKKL